MEEIWKPIEGYEELYEVSNLGRVRSLEFRNGTSRLRRTKVLTPTDNGHGYMIVGLNAGKKAKRKNYYVHRLVAKAFVPNPGNLPVIDHVDHDRANNKASNLRWLTQGDNVRHSRKLMCKPRQKPMSNTGERYISKQKKDGKYRLTINLKQIGVFDTIEEAKAVRDEILKEA